MDNGGRFRSGHYPKLAITCSTQQEVVCLRFILATRRVLLGLGNGAACVVHALPAVNSLNYYQHCFSGRLAQSDITQTLYWGV